MAPAVVIDQHIVFFAYRVVLVIVSSFVHCLGIDFVVVVVL